LLCVCCLYLAAYLTYKGIKTPDLSDSEKIGECSMSGKGQPIERYICYELSQVKCEYDD
jgi:hypothetical protein